MTLRISTALAAALITLNTVVCSVHAQAPATDTPAGELTAEELLQKANADYAAGKWEDAANGLTQFIKAYGGRAEAAQLVSRLRYPVARAWLQAGKFEATIAAIEEALRSTPPVAQQEAQELMYWKGLCLLRLEKNGASRDALEKFVAVFPRDAWKQAAYVTQFPVSRNVPEAQLLAGMSYLLDDKLRDAADYFAKIKPSLTPVYRGRASVLELHALISSDQPLKAVEVVESEFPRLDDMLQLATFQTLTLQLGSELLDRGEYRKAIACLLRVWPAERITTFQEKRLTDLGTRLAAMEANPRSDAAQKQILGELITKIRRELEQFRKIQNFDSALRLRLATAFQSMQRYREAALILESMLNELPPDSVVEQASISLIQCWGQIERWPKVVEAADAFVLKFPKSKSIPLALYLKGSAQQKDAQFDGAVETFSGIGKDYATSDYAPRALFMEGFTRLLADKPKEAIPVFEKFAQTYPKHEMADPAAYWRGMAYSLDKQFEKCRSVMDEYLAAYPQGANRALAVFRKAYAIHSLRNYKASVAELRAYLKANPGDESNNEALVLLGDALMSVGEMDEGIAAFKRIPPTEVRFFEEGWFKIGKALKLLERYNDLRTHMETFVKDHPRSGRVGEAIYWVGWVYRQEGKTDEARKLYWDTLKQHGNDPSIRSVDDLFPALVKLYQGEDERRKYVAELSDLAEEARRKGEKTKELRALWAESRQLEKIDREKSLSLMFDAAKLVDVKTTNSLQMADFADAYTAAKRDQEAEQMWRDLIKWNPRAPQKDRALAALGNLELSRGNQKAALDYFDRFEKETMGSFLFAGVQLTRAKLLDERGNYEDAQKALESLLAQKAAGGKQKSEALYRIGEIQMRQGKPQLAVPYFQRIYVMYGRWPEWVAKAYLRSGEAFEQLKDLDAARKTYQEMIDNALLSEQPERTQAEARLQKIGAPAPSEKPATTPL